MRTLIVSLIAFLAVSCSSSPKSEPAAPTEPAAAPATEPAPAEPATTEPTPAEPAASASAWESLTGKEKAKIMKEKVVPAVAAIWKESPEPDEEVTCVLCHGQGAKKGEFEMPSRSIPSLDPSNSFAKHQDEKEWLTFMSKKLSPTVAAAIGVEPWSPENHDGFGCFSCHKRAGE